MVCDLTDSRHWSPRYGAVLRLVLFNWTGTIYVSYIV